MRDNVIQDVFEDSQGRYGLVTNDGLNRFDYTY
jgi:hypothetical protein